MRTHFLRALPHSGQASLIVAAALAEDLGINADAIVAESQTEPVRLMPGIVKTVPRRGYLFADDVTTPNPLFDARDLPLPPGNVSPPLQGITIRTSANPSSRLAYQQRFTNLNSVVSLVHFMLSNRKVLPLSARSVTWRPSQVPPAAASSFICLPCWETGAFGSTSRES